MPRFLFLLVALLALVGCDAFSETESQVRIQNATTADIETVTVAFNTPSQTFGPIESGETTAYKTFERVYDLAYIEVEADGQTYALQPTDYVGEAPRPGGSYTLRIVALDDRHVTFDLVEDLVED